MPELLEKTATVEDVLHEVSKIKDVVTDAVEDGFQSAVKALKQGREAAEDALADARHAVKRNPFEAVGAAFAAGVLIGGLATFFASRRR